MGIRQADVSDAERILHIRAIAHNEYYPNRKLEITSQAVVATETQMREPNKLALTDSIMDASRFLVEVYENGRGVFGYSIASKNDGHRIDYLHILRHSRKQGIGRELVENALDWLGDIEPVSLTVVPYNTPAKEFWESLGFIATGKDAPPTTLKNGILVPHIWMERQPEQRVLASYN